MPSARQEQITPCIGTEVLNKRGEQMNDDIEAKNCTLCGQDNQCGNLQSGSKEPCWCVKESFPEGYLSLSMSRVPYFLSKK
ncbi:hypothetical protein EIZ39_04160 [Ammoniphilus sp. CFH 90114]|nr:hypothetical protein EIZ39_04160 [Ammoniphilus sp. CFH 90114]